MEDQFNRVAFGGAARALNAYVDSSVVLRIVLREPKKLGIWSKISNPVSNDIIRLECLRTLDRARIRLGLKDQEVSRYRASALDILEAFDLVPLDEPVLERAADPFPTLLGSLDAIHLATALAVREERDDLTMATHDEELGIAAQAVGFQVEGLSR